MEGDSGEAPEEAAEGIFLERGSFHHYLRINLS
jgi:hypothetical protein